MKKTLAYCPPAVFFDLDGTLIDSAPDLGGAAEQMRRARGLPPLGWQAYRSVAGSGARGMLHLAFGITPSDSAFESMRREFLENYEHHIADASYVFEGVETMLQGLNARGIAWGIITNKPIFYTQLLLEKFPLLQGAAAVVGGDSAHAPKPDAAPMFMAAQNAGVAIDECWYVGDDKRDIDAARAAKMAGAFAACWGYMGEHAVADWHADALLARPEDLLDFCIAR